MFVGDVSPTPPLRGDIKQARADVRVRARRGVVAKSKEQPTFRAIAPAARRAQNIPPRTIVVCVVTVICCFTR